MWQRLTSVVLTIFMAPLAADLLCAAAQGGGAAAAR